MSRKQIPNRPERSVVFQTQIESRIPVIAHSDCRFEVPTVMPPRAPQGSADDWIKIQLVATESLFQDRSELQRHRILFIGFTREAYLAAETDVDGQMPGLGRGDWRTT